MTLLNVQSFSCGEWINPSPASTIIHSAIDGSEIAKAGTDGLAFQDMIDFAKNRGGPALRAMTFHDRAKMLKALALHLKEHRDQLYALSFNTGATLPDSQIDIDGGIGTLLVFASKGRREMPNETVYLDGDVEMLSRNGTFLGQHVCTSLQGVAVHINAYNFPVWGMRQAAAEIYSTILEARTSLVLQALLRRLNRFAPNRIFCATRSGLLLSKIA